MTNLEKNFKTRLLKRLNNIEHGYFFCKEALALRGLPDIIGVYKGMFVGLECKKSESESRRSTGRTPLQNHILQKIKIAGGFAEFIYPENEDEVLQEMILHRQVCPRE